MALLVPIETLREVLQVGASVSDTTLTRISTAAEKAFMRYLRVKDDAGEVIDYSEELGVREGILVVAIDMFGAEKATGGQTQGIDFQPTPRVNPFIVTRAVQTYALDFFDVGGWIA